MVVYLGILFMQEQLQDFTFNCYPIYFKITNFIYLIQTTFKLNRDQRLLFTNVVLQTKKPKNLTNYFRYELINKNDYLFISDIRTANFKSMTPIENEKAVLRDNQL